MEYTNYALDLFVFVCFLCPYRAAFILALVITIAVVVTRDNDDDSTDEQSRSDNNPGRIINRNEFSTLMQSFDGPIFGE